jgi:glycosyltransferase involved in cell wall biosynthesis
LLAAHAGERQPVCTGRQVVIVIDATPLQNEHRHRGIGYYVRGLLNALAKADISGWAPLTYAGVALPEPLAQRSGPRIWKPKRLEYHGGWLLDELALPLLARTGRWQGFHATDPRTVPEPRLLRVVSTIYDLTPLNDADVWRSLSIDQRIAYRRALSNARRAAVVVTISHAVKRELVDRLEIPPDRVHVVYPGIDLDDWIAPTPTDHVRSGLLFVGAPAPHKNLGVLMTALAILPPAHRPPLTVVGPWQDRDIQALQAQASELGCDPPRVEAYAPATRLRELYARSAALIMPSRMEGFGLPVLEAMASGCPVVASDIPVHREISEGVATLVPVGDAHLLAAAIDDLLVDGVKAGRQGDAGPGRAAKFSWSTSLAALLASYLAAGIVLD